MTTEHPYSDHQAFFDNAQLQEASTVKNHISQMREPLLRKLLADPHTP